MRINYFLNAWIKRVRFKNWPNASWYVRLTRSVFLLLQKKAKYHWDQWKMADWYQIVFFMLIDCFWSFPDPLSHEIGVEQIQRITLNSLRLDTLWGGWSKHIIYMYGYITMKPLVQLIYTKKKKIRSWNINNFSGNSRTFTKWFRQPELSILQPLSRMKFFRTHKSKPQSLVIFFLWFKPKSYTSSHSHLFTQEYNFRGQTFKKAFKFQGLFSNR
jgi:hypothetical protein